MYVYITITHNKIVSHELVPPVPAIIYCITNKLIANTAILACSHLVGSTITLSCEIESRKTHITIYTTLIIINEKIGNTEAS